MNAVNHVPCAMWDNVHALLAVRVGAFFRRAPSTGREPKYLVSFQSNRTKRGRDQVLVSSLMFDISAPDAFRVAQPASEDHHATKAVKPHATDSEFVTGVSVITQRPQVQKGRRLLEIYGDVRRNLYL